jgi:peptidoglycan/xylan/chitin deacetylase (PgdA/CDA1 family)
MKTPCAITVDVEGDYWDANTTLGIIHGIPLILDLLKRLDIKGSFFWTAEAAKKHPDILSRVMNEGHEIGCHGYRHENFTALEKKQQSKIIDEATLILRSLGADCKGFRAPRLRVNHTLFQILPDHGYSYDSSIPFWGIRRYKYGKRYDNITLTELKCIPSYAFRLFNHHFLKIISHSSQHLGYIVFFLHPWEVIKQPITTSQMPLLKRLNLINTLNVGPIFLSGLESYLFMVKENFLFRTCLELSSMIEKRANNLKT